MPQTINGIGTRYHGAANRSARVGVCEFCKRSATISSYDTREFFCIIYIPLIPMTRFRIVDDCSSCRRHRRVKADDFSKQVEQAVAPLREAIRRSPSDPQPYVDLVRTLAGWEMRGDAGRELASAMAVFPKNFDLTMLAAQLAIDGGDLNGALPLYERAHGLDPQNATATYGYGWLLHQLDRHEQAVLILERAASFSAHRVGALYLIGASNMKLARWNQALHAFQQLVGAEPSYMGDKKLMRLMGECKKHLGYELNGAERRAGRRWWPFGGGTKKRAALQPHPTLVRPSLRIAGIILLVVAAAAGAVTAWDRRSNIEVYLDNGLDRVVNVELDGRHFDVPRSASRKEVLKEGAHSLVVREKSGKEIERLSFKIDELGLFDSVMHDRFFVYNVASQHVYRRATLGYAASEESSSYSDELVGMKRFFEQRDVDYPFQTAPDEIKLDSKSSVVKKVAFNTAGDIDLARYAILRLRQGKTDEANKAIAQAAANAPCSTRTRRTQVYFAGLNGSAVAASETARRWIADCPEDDLEAHRSYQDVNRESGHREAMREEYRKSLAASPRSGKAHYLYGRVTSDPAAAAVEYQMAVQLDPKLVWPRIALGHAYEQMERHDEALREFSAALDMEGRDPSAVMDYAMAAIAKGTPDAAVSKVDEARKSHPKESAGAEARWLLALAAGDWQKAAELKKFFEPLDGPESAWWRNTKLLRLKGDPAVDARIDAALSSPALRGMAVQAQIERMIEKGDYAQTADVIAKHAKDLDVPTAALLEAYAAGGLLMRGDAPGASMLLAGAEKMLADQEDTPGRRVAATVVAGLRGSMPADVVMASLRDSEVPVHGWFVAGVRAAVAKDRARSADNFAHCVRAASDLEFPYLEVKAMVAASGQ